MSTHRILVINPGSTSTRLALFEGDHCTAEEIVPARPRDGALIDELPLRTATVGAFLERHGDSPLHAVVARGGLFRSVPSGTIVIDDEMLEDARRGARGEHPSNLGCLIAREIARRYAVPSFIVDPVCVDEMLPEARITGLPQIRRESLSHALNLHAAARRAADFLRVEYSKSRFVAAHLGGGFSIVAMKGGKIVDTSNANSGGPFAPTRAGTLPTQALMRLCFSGRYTIADLKRMTTREGGLMAHLGTADAREVERRIDEGDVHAREIYDAMAYHTAKEIGAMATVLKGRLDAVVLTGGLAHSEVFCRRLSNRVKYFGRILRFPGEFEMQALAAGALRVLRGEEKPLEYSQGVTV